MSMQKLAGYLWKFHDEEWRHDLNFALQDKARDHWMSAVEDVSPNVPLRFQLKTMPEGSPQHYDVPAHTIDSQIHHFQFLTITVLSEFRPWLEAVVMDTEVNFFVGSNLRTYFNDVFRTVVEHAYVWETYVEFRHVDRDAEQIHRVYLWNTRGKDVVYL